MRKPIGVASYEFQKTSRLVVVCDDGTVWEREWHWNSPNKAEAWKQLNSVPGTQSDPNKEPPTMTML